MAFLLHIAERSSWEAAVACGFYAPSSLKTEGFIHCSSPTRIVDTANNFFRGKLGLVLLCIDEDKVSAPLKYERSTGKSLDAPGVGALFPHLYGPLRTNEVVRIVEFSPDGHGGFTLPPEIADLVARGVKGTLPPSHARALERIFARTKDDPRFLGVAAHAC